MFVEQRGKLGIAFLRADEDDFGDSLPAASAMAQERLKEPVLHKQRDDAEQREDHHDAAAEHGQTEEVHGGHDRQRADGAALDENPHGVAKLLAVGAAVKAVDVEKKRIQREHDQVQPLVIAKRRDHSELNRVPEEVVRKRERKGELLAQRVGKPEDDGNQQPVSDLADLNDEFSSSI